MSTTTPQLKRRHPPAFIQSLIVSLLRSPFHSALSNNLMLLTFTGRKSGKQFTAPVTYSHGQDGTIIVFSSNPWSKNLIGGAPVSMLIQRKQVQGYATAIAERAVVLKETRAYLDKKGVRNARMIGLELGTKRDPTPEELDAATQGRVVIFIEPRS